MAGGVASNLGAWLQCLGAWPQGGGVAPGVRRAQTLGREMEKEKEEEKRRDEEAGRAGLWEHADQAAGTPARCVIGWIQAKRGYTRTPRDLRANTHKQTHTFTQHIHTRLTNTHTHV